MRSMGDIDESWIDSLQGEHESAKEWAIKRSFLISHYDKYSRERLVCLAHCFINMELYGCSYPQEVMREVHGLAAQMDDVHEYRKARKEQEAKRIKFVQETAPQSSKAKDEQLKERKRSAQNTQVASANKKKKIKPIKCVKPTLDGAYQASYEKLKEFLHLKEETVADMFTADKVLTFLPSSYAMLHNSLNNQQPAALECILNENNKTYEFKVLGQMLCWAKAQKLEKHLESIHAPGKTKAKKAGFLLAHHLLMNVLDRCIIVIRKQLSNAGSVVTNQNIEGSAIQTTDMSKGMMLLKSLGWSEGEGLGSKNHGIKAPVALQTSRNREGLGFASSGKSFRECAQSYLEDYIKQNRTDVLIFSKDFDNEDRKQLHEIARILGLKSKSRGKGDERCLTISRKDLSLEDQLKPLIEREEYETDWCSIINPLAKNVIWTDS